MIFKDRELRRIRDLVIGTVFVFEKKTNLRRREFVRVATIDIDDHRVARLHEFSAAAQMTREDLLPHRHRPLRRVRNRQLDLAALECFCKREQSAFANDELRDRIVFFVELFERYTFAGLQADQHVVVGHEQTLIDVVAGVDRRE